MYKKDFAYDGPIFLVPLSLSYPSSPVDIFPTNVFSNVMILSWKLFDLIGPLYRYFFKITYCCPGVNAVIR